MAFDVWVFACANNNSGSLRENHHRKSFDKARKGLTCQVSYCLLR